MKMIRKIVIKVGTSTLTQGSQKLSRRYMLDLVQQIAHLRKEGLELVLVSSGAVATGRELLSSNKMDRLEPSKQTLACIGQIKLMQVWFELFSLFDMQVGQLLLTKDDFSLDKQSITKDALNCMLDHHIIPIVNGNDAVLCAWNNDSLAGCIANLIRADTVLLLTDQKGLYTADPRLDPKAELISIVNQIDEKIYALAGESSTSLGTGGMTTKIEAADIASQSGAQTIIASSFHPNVLIELIKGKQIGTLFFNKTVQEGGKVS